jgi:hypothetical protein
MRYKLLKPDWAQPYIKGKDRKPNPAFIQEIPGSEDTLEGDFTEEFLAQKNQEGYNVYFFPNFPKTLHPEIKYARGEHIDVFDFVFVDMDLKEGVYPTKEAFLSKLREFPIQPFLVVDSGHGIHAYWKISNLTRNDFVFTQLQLIQTFTTDDSIWTVKQIMRAPGYNNTKRFGEFVPAAVVPGFQGIEVSLETLRSALSPLTADNKTRGQRHLDKMDGIESDEDLEDLDVSELPEKFKDDIAKDPFLKQIWEDPKSYRGDRSSADMKLANMLFNLDYDRTEAYTVLMNTEKARSRDAHNRHTYAFTVVDKVYKDRPKFYEDTVADYVKTEGDFIELGKEVRGPEWMDVQEEKWRRGQVLGLVLGTGMGKSTLSLDIIKHILQNNPKGRFVYFSLEMSKKSMIDKWLRLTRNDMALAARLHIVANETKSNDIRHIGLQEVVWITKDIKKVTGDEIIGIGIDHMGELSNVVDLTKNPAFNAKGELGQGAGDKRFRALGYQSLCSKVKDIAKMLNVFVIMQSQTSRLYDIMGDIPIPKSGAFGASNFEKMVHWMVTGWQPLLRVYTKTNMRVTAWQYCKLRTVGERDPIKLNDPRLLLFDMKMGAYRTLTDDEMEEVKLLTEEADKLRLAQEKNKGGGVVYGNSPGKLLELVAQYERLKSNGKV